jgi:Abnormal spindle-like microcephaly-assoc'd, ASPM-SPD-2-Hydin
LKSGTKKSFLPAFAIIWIAAGVFATPNAAGQAAVTLSTNILNFPAQLASTTSAAQTATLTNSGDQPLTILSIVLAGLFTQTNDCPASPMTLPPGGSCTFTVTFQPLTGGPAAGLITITDNAVPSPQVISLGGTGQDFSLSISPSSATVTAGQSATFTLTVTPAGGFNLPVTFSCSDLPGAASCSFSQNPVTLDGTNAAMVTVTVSTTARALTVPGGGPESAPPNLWTRRWLWVLLIGLAGLVAVRRRRLGRAAASVALGLLLLAALAISACGGGSGGSSGGGSGTPAGSYSLLVTGSTPAGSGTLQNPVSMTLVVQ